MIPSPWGSTCSTGSTGERREDQEVKAVPNETAGKESRPTVGRYHPEHVQLTREEECQEQLRGVLDAAEEKEWHLGSV